MIFGARVGFDIIEELEAHFRGVDFAVEIALPYQVGNFLKISDRMNEVRDFVQDRGIEVHSIHAPQGNLLLDAYKRWAEPTMKLADELDTKSVTFHPNQTKQQRLDGQLMARQHIKDLQGNAKALVAIETFGGRRRVFYPEEIVDLRIPMVVDTAHLHGNDRILNLIRKYHESIPTVHLSARGQNEHHLPIDDFCLQVVQLLKELDWQGGIILEYLPWHHYRVKDDLVLLKLFFDGKHDIELPPPDDKFKHDESMWGFA